MAMAAELKRRTGLSPDDVDLAFITHQHGDHHVGLAHFRKAKWIAGAKAAANLNKSGKYSKQIEVASQNLAETIDVVYTPGHTLDSYSLCFDCDGMSVIIAGDAVATRDFWKEGRMYFKALDMNLSARSMEKIRSIADVIVPGHDNYFFCR